MARSIVPLNPTCQIEWDTTPEEVLACWPEEEPLAVLYSGEGPPEQSRWSILARPSEVIRVRPGEDWTRACNFLLRTIARRPSAPGTGSIFTGGWIGWVSYDFGRTMEPKAQWSGGAARDRDWNVMEWQRCDQALVHDRATRAWWVVGKGWERVWRDGIGLGLARSSRRGDHGSVSRGWCTPEPKPTDKARRNYMDACERVLGYIRAGDAYQVNLAHRLSHMFEGSTRGLFQRLVRTASPWFGAYLEDTHNGGRHAICSVSPELLFRLDGATSRVITRPMKGTRRPGDGAVEALLQSEKDRAELNMIVDLMRNDLGRICEFGTVHVERPREVEWHGREAAPATVPNAKLGRVQERVGDASGILQATATVSGIVRRGVTLAEVMRALVPGGSVTGAPKIRAMQIIDELEVARRGPYCGAIGFVGDDGSGAMNVGIRTALVRGRANTQSRACDAVLDGTLDYSVGAGIVADSVAEAEWQETLEKARALQHALSLGARD